VLCFAASRWLADFIQKNFYFQDYIHAYKWRVQEYLWFLLLGVRCFYCKMQIRNV
jgi:hypothetical protein